MAVDDIKWFDFVVALVGTWMWCCFGMVIAHVPVGLAVSLNWFQRCFGCLPACIVAHLPRNRRGWRKLQTVVCFMQQIVMGLTYVFVSAIAFVAALLIVNALVVNTIKPLLPNSIQSCISGQHCHLPNWIIFNSIILVTIESILQAMENAMEKNDIVQSEFMLIVDAGSGVADFTVGRVFDGHWHDTNTSHMQTSDDPKSLSNVVLYIQNLCRQYPFVTKIVLIGSSADSLTSLLQSNSTNNANPMFKYREQFKPHDDYC